MPRKLKSLALRSDAVTVANIPNGEISAIKLTADAVTGNLGYIPTSPTTLASTVTTINNSIATKVSKSGDTITGNLVIEKNAPSILLNDTSDAGVDVAIGSVNENFYVYEPEDTGGTQVPGNLGKEWFRIDDDGDAYVFTRKVWDAGTAPSAAIRVTQNNSSTPLAIQNSNYNIIQHEITRTLTTSKVLVMAKWAWSADNPNGHWRIERSYDNSNWSVISYILSRDEAAGANAGDAMEVTEIFMDSPSSSYLTVYYRVFWLHNVQNGGTMYIGRTANNDLMGSGNFNRSITLIEVAS